MRSNSLSAFCSFSETNLTLFRLIMKTTQVASSSSGGVNNKKRKLNEVSQSKKENDQKTINSKPNSAAE